MAKSFSSRLKDAFNVFRDKEDDTNLQWIVNEPGSAIRPDRPNRYIRGGERTIIASIYNRIALDVSDINIKHVRLDENGRYIQTIRSGINECLTLEANIDQTSRDFVKDLVISMFEEGCVAVVPIDTTVNPDNTESYDILSMRTGKIKEWFPSKVRVEVYNELTGKKQEITLDKSKVAIIENPLYYVMNGENSTLQRLIRKLSLLDLIDNQSSSGKLDLIIQLPYVIKTPTKMEEAEKRKKQIEDQLYNSKYGIAYIDGTEKVTQLNRSIDNNLLAQIEYLTKLLYSQLGLAQSVFEGTANSQEMNNYLGRTVKPIMSAITEELKRKFLTKTARTQGQSIEFFNDPFKFIPTEQLAEMADKFTRNEIMTSNEFRQAIGLQASNDPNADVLRNKNLNQEASANPMSVDGRSIEDVNQPEDLDALDSELQAMETELSQSMELIHYSSPYYDPVKAHEYYMRTRKLKEGDNKKSLNDTGKEAVAYVKDRIKTERDTNVQNAKDEYENFNKQVKQQIALITQKMSKAESLSPAQKSALQGQISRLRQAVQRKKSQISKISKNYADVSKQEVERIKNDSSMVGGTSSKKSKKKS